MFSGLPRDARKMVGQPFDAEKLSDIFLRHGIRGWVVRTIDHNPEDEPGYTYTRSTSYHNKYHHLRIKARSGYAKLFAAASQIIHPKATMAETAERMQRHTQRTMRRFEIGFEFGVDHFCWQIERINLPKQADQGEKRPHIEVSDGIVTSMKMRYPG